MVSQAFAVIVLGRSTEPSSLSNAQVHAERLPVCYVASTSAFLSLPTVNPSSRHVKYTIASTNDQYSGSRVKKR